MQVGDADAGVRGFLTRMFRFTQILYTSYWDNFKMYAIPCSVHISASV